MILMSLKLPRNMWILKKQDKRIDKVIGFVYANFIKFKQNDLVEYFRPIFWKMFVI